MLESARDGIGVRHQRVGIGKVHLRRPSRFVGEKADVGLAALDAVDDGRRIRHRQQRIRHLTARGELAHQIGDRAGDRARLRIDSALHRIRGQERGAQRPGGRQIGRGAAGSGEDNGEQEMLKQHACAHYSQRACDGAAARWKSEVTK